MVYPVSVYVYITLLLTFKSFWWWSTLFLVRLMVVFISYIHIRYCVIDDHNFLSPYSSLPYLPIPPYIYVQYFTQSCVNIQVISRMAYLIYLSPLSIYLSCVIYLSYLSPYLISNIYYIYNKYPIYLSLPYNLYTHDHICSIFIVDYVNYLGNI